MTDNTGLIVTVVIFCFIFAWIITFSILAMVFKKPIFEKLSIIGPLGHSVHLASKGISLQSQAYHRLEKKGNIATYSSAAPSYPNLNSSAAPTPRQSSITTGGYHDYDDNDEDIDPDF